MPPLDYQLGLLKIPVTHIRACADFYREVLGFVEEFVVSEYGWAQLSAGDLPVALYVPGTGGGDDAVGGSIGFLLSLPPEAFDMLAADLLPRGVLVEDKVHTSDDGMTFPDVRDPDGNVLKIGRGD